ncbi:ankyrin repeat domain-containing protein 50-like [Dermacentor silvarum]|uniref:ankyrin repeat domain-containing protein 50-like n=1 Tax=Dermacentor silvarum TaxID=543639 RepID=UPI002100A0AF|nr:ankyrin repeat domain-containing protein 50-like [Dermacentor silvarum]
MSSPLQPAATTGDGLGCNRRRFLCREWAFAKLAHCLDQRPASKTCGALVVGGPGCGKTAFFQEIAQPTVADPEARQHVLSRRLLAHHFCQAHDTRTLAVASFVLGLVRQLCRCEQVGLLSGYRDRLREAEAALEPAVCARWPDEAFKKAVLFPLLEIEPPEQPCLLLVDSVDESLLVQVNISGMTGNGSHRRHRHHHHHHGGEQRHHTSSEGGRGSRTIAELLAAHQQLFPQWLLLVCSARRQSKTITRMFTGFRKISLDDLRKASVVRDMQQYILARLDGEEALRQQLGARDTAEALNQLHIKSNGCLLYLECLLDGVAQRWVTLREIRHIPGTLNGLYLWLCQRLFQRRQFLRVQPVLHVLLASAQPLTADELFLCLWTRNQLLTRDEFSRRLALLSRLLVEREDGCLLLFHHSFAEWLLDVKHCTQKYLCHAAEGHAMLAMMQTLRGPHLPPTQVQDLAHHLLRLPACDAVEPHHLPLWLLYSDVPLEWAFCPTVGSVVIPRDPAVLRLLLEAGARLPTDTASASMAGSDDGGSPVPSMPPDPLDALLGSGASVDDVDGNQRSLLHTAAYEGDAALVERLLEAKASLELADRNGQTPLNLGLLNGQTVMFSPDVWCLEEQFNLGCHKSACCHCFMQVDHICVEGATALGIASQEGHEAVVRALLEHGADPSHADQCGRSPLRVATKAGHLNVVRLLEESLALGRSTQALGSVSTSSLASAASTAPCAAPLFCPESPESTSDKRRSLASTHSDSKSSSNRTDSTARSQHNAGVTTLAEPGATSLSFTQQIQQCTRSRHRASRVLSPLNSEGRSPSSPTSCNWPPAAVVPPRRGPLPDLPVMAVDARPRRNGIVTNPNCKGNKRSTSDQLHSKVANYREGVKGPVLPVKKETPL